MTKKQRLAVRDTIGWTPDRDQMEDAVAQHAGKTTEQLAAAEDAAAKVLDAIGGRGVAAAEELDGLRIALAARQSLPPEPVVVTSGLLQYRITSLPAGSVKVEHLNPHAPGQLLNDPKKPGKSFTTPEAAWKHVGEKLGWF